MYVVFSTLILHEWECSTGKFVPVQRHALWQDILHSCDSSGMPHIYLCGIHIRRVMFKKIVATLFKVHARNASRRRRALRPRDARAKGRRSQK